MNVRLHPERTADPLTLRWVTDTAALAEPTAQMAELLADGTLAELTIAPGEIRTTLAPGGDWGAVGQRVRSVLFETLSGAGGDPGTLHQQVSEVLRTDVAPYVDSHGGEIRIHSLTDDGTLTVSLGGTCGRCTMRTATLRNVVAGAVQARVPGIRAVRAVRG